MVKAPATSEDAPPGRSHHEPARSSPPPHAASSHEPDAWEDLAEADHAAGDALLRLHAAELIDRIQRWARDLDARQSQLNLQSVSQDQRERQFRLWALARETELQERLQAIEQRERIIRESARRLAFAELAPP